MQFDVSPNIAGNGLSEDTQTVRPCACDLLSTPKNVDFFFNSTRYILRSPGFWALRSVDW